MTRESDARRSSVRQDGNELAAIRERIEKLEQRRVALNEELMQVSDQRRANAIERELRAIRTAIRHYQAALEIESDLPR